MVAIYGCLERDNDSSYFEISVCLCYADSFNKPRTLKLQN